ncbi:TonB family protein [Myxococcaceae bacterium GXIMD 01537]
MEAHPAVGQSLLVARPSPVGRFIVFSVVGHVGVLLAALLYARLGSGPRVDLDAKPIRASLVRLGKPRDAKLLPRKETAPPPPKEVKAAPAPAVPTPPSNAVAVPVPGAKPQPSTPAAAQPGEKTGEDRRKRLFGAFDKMAKPTPAEDLEGAEDGDPNGDSATEEGERYYGLLSSQIRRHYSVADTIPESERLHLKAQVAIRLGRKGELVGEPSLAKSSGNEVFDAAVLVAVRKAAPFSPPPDHIRDPLQKSGVVLEFRP